MYKKLLKKIPVTTIPVILCVVMLCALVFLINYRINAESTGNMVGEGTGTLVGRAVGSLEGLTVGQIEGHQAGKEAGLSAKDTTAELSGKIQKVEKLQVLVASGTYSDILTVGDDYAALLSQQYNAVFTVDLGTAEIELREDGLHILLEQPSVEFIPVGDIVKENEYQKNGFTGSTEDGYDALNNSANQMKQKATEKLAGDASMMAAARSSAETQLIGLVNAVSLSKPEVIIEWRAN